MWYGVCVVWVHEGVVLCDELCVVLLVCGVWVFYFSLSLNFLLSFSRSLSLFLSCSFLLLSCLPLSLFSSSSFLFSLPFSPTTLYKALINQQTSRRSDVIWRTAGAQQSVPSLFLPPSLPHPEKREGPFLLQEYFRRGIYFFYYSFK